MSGDTRRGRRASIRRTWAEAKAWSSDEEVCYFTILPLRGVYLILSSRVSLVICPTQRDFIYIALGFQGKPSI
jgi:hypothetical protein